MFAMKQPMLACLIADLTVGLGSFQQRSQTKRTVTGPAFTCLSQEPQHRAPAAAVSCCVPVCLQEFGIGFLLHFIFAAIYLLVWGMDM